MRFKKAKRVIALVMAALMVVGVMPVIDGGIKKVNAADNTLLILNASDIAEGDITEAKVVGDFKLGASASKKFTVQADGKTSADKTLTFKNRLKTNGGSSDTERIITFDTTAAATVTVYMLTGSNSDLNRTLTLYDANNVSAGVNKAPVAGDGGTITPVEYTIKEAGTYTFKASAAVNIYYIAVQQEAAEGREIALNASDIAEGDITEAKVVGDFKLGASASKKFTVQADGKTSADKTLTFKNRLKTNGGSSDTERIITFDTTAAATVTVYMLTGSNSDLNRTLTLYDANNVSAGVNKAPVAGDGGTITPVEYTIKEAGTYTFKASAAVNIYYISVVESAGGTAPEKTPWAEVAAPVLGTPALKAGDAGVIEVPYTMVIDKVTGADSVIVTVKNAGGEVIKEITSFALGTSGVVEFKPSESGSYTFSIKATRKDEEDKLGESEVTFENFSYPLGKSSIGLIHNKGNGTAHLEWSAVKEATSYTVEYSADNTTWTKVEAADKLTADVSGLTVGSKYSFRVVAKRDTETTTSDVVSMAITGEAQQAWGYIAYGNGASQSNGKVVGNLNEDGKVQLTAGNWSQNADGTWAAGGNNGKWVPATYDGLGFYYTTVPASQNFTLRAKVTVDEWYLSNGQEAFGIMANDKLGGTGWNNSYSAYISKNEYYWDGTDVTTDTSAQKVTQKLGIGSQEKVGVTKDNLAKLELNDQDTIKNEFKTSAYPLEQRYPDAGNIIGNGVNTPVSDGVTGITEMYLQIQKNNTGYFVTYESVDGSYKMTKKYYDTKALEQLDADNVYVGLFLARYGKVTFSDVTLKTIDPKDDAPAEERPVEKIAVNTSVQSPTATGNKTYEFAFSANCDGTLSIYDAKGNAIAENVAVKADTAIKTATTELSIGKNNYKLVFTPDANYVPGEYKVMESYEPVEIKHTVSYAVYGNPGESLWVAPDAKGNGTKANPMSIYDAVKYVQPGQTIVLMGGKYNLEKTVKVERGIDGIGAAQMARSVDDTEDKKIYMVADPDATERPVLDFGGICAGMVLAGDYWVFRGFDVTNSADGQKGIQVSGSYNLLDNINAYRNGNTGIQISRYLTTDEYKDWPAYNTILNCTSYGNADKGFEDADGFAAKLTVGAGNVFDGCIAHHNADDGWDLFAKAQTGSIGAVTIKNSIAYANGYTEAGGEAGNGNGFKMGGDSLSGKHVLQNCVAYDNKAKGIDSNSCPDIIVKDCISYNNGSYNVAFYTNLKSLDTDYSADNVVSFRTKAPEIGENIKLQGKQDKSKVYKDTTYFWDATAGKSLNSSGAEATADWFEALDTSVVPTRNADGTINMHGLLKITDKAPEVMRNAGLTVFTASDATVVPPSIKAEDIKTGDATPIALYIVLAVLSLAALAGVAVFSKKKIVK